MSDKPIGSGIFAIFFGVLFCIALFYSSEIEKISSAVILKTWLGFIGAVLVLWGATRVVTTENKSLAVGQDTINWVIGIFAATLALLELLHPHH